MAQKPLHPDIVGQHGVNLGRGNRDTLGRGGGEFHRDWIRRILRPRDMLIVLDTIRCTAGTTFVCHNLSVQLLQLRHSDSRRTRRQTFSQMLYPILLPKFYPVCGHGFTVAVSAAKIAGKADVSVDTLLSIASPTRHGLQGRCRRAS